MSSVEALWCSFHTSAFVHLSILTSFKVMELRTIIVKGVIISLISFIVSCAPKAKVVDLKENFDPNEVSWIFQGGNNTISGEAFLRTIGGEVRTCAGLDVILIPVSRYSTKRIQVLYGNTNAGYIPLFSGKRIVFKPDPPLYYKYMKKAKCDASGHFKFTNLPDGEYYIIANVMWSVGGYIPSQGGYLMQRVKVNGGETREIIMTYP